MTRKRGPDRSDHSAFSRFTLDTVQRGLVAPTRGVSGRSESLLFLFPSRLFDPTLFPLSFRRTSGILLHITSLPSRYGIGDIGPEAHRFVDMLADLNQQLWQVLPLGPVGHGASPYSSLSAFAGNPLLLSPDRLVDEGLVSDGDVDPLRDLPSNRVDFARLIPRKTRVLRTAYDRFSDTRSTRSSLARAFDEFCLENAGWLDDYALFMALKDAHDGAPWYDWDRSLLRRRPAALHKARDTHADAIEMHAFWQFLFNREWTDLHARCRAQGVKLFGDMPIYAAHDSADVWANQDLFSLDEDGQPTDVAGVPPDYFSPDGQRWGNPLYQWDTMAARDFDWWTRRVDHVLSRVDLVRIDHFRGFEAYWAIPAEEETAIQGEWVEGPGARLFETLQNELGDVPVVAEDLGVITDDVRALRDRFGFPGMAILQFAFGDTPQNDYLPHNYDANTVAYTGTHDNDTLLGWWNGPIPDGERDFTRRYLSADAASIVERSLRALLASSANRVVTPMQDVLELGTEGRMNVPGEASGNWTWRCTREDLHHPNFEHLAELTYLFGRSPKDVTGAPSAGAIKSDGS